MILKLNNNDILEASNLMSKTYDYDKYSYSKNEAYWMHGLINKVTLQSEGNKNYMAIKTLNGNNISAFLLASTFNESYSGDVVFNIDDMIVDYSLGKIKNAKDTKCLIEYLIEYCKANNVNHWRADTIHKSEESLKYIKFLNKKFDGEISYTFRGEIK